LRRFGGLALIAFAALAVTGLIQAAEQLRDVSDLWTSAYGVVLATKTAGVAAMLAMSAVTWRRGVPLARAEAAVALAVVATSALLVAFPNTPGQA
jgi:putative copper export protein